MMGMYQRYTGATRKSSHLPKKNLIDEIDEVLLHYGPKYEMNIHESILI